VEDEEKKRPVDDLPRLCFVFPSMLWQEHTIFWHVHHLSIEPRKLGQTQPCIPVGSLKCIGY